MISIVKFEKLEMNQSNMYIDGSNEGERPQFNCISVIIVV